MKNTEVGAGGVVRQRRLVPLRDIIKKNVCQISESCFYSGKARGRYPFLSKEAPDGTQSRFLWVDIDELRYHDVVLGRHLLISDAAFKKIEKMAEDIIDFLKKNKNIY